MLPASNRGVGMNICFPDVCLTPPMGAPVPYVNLGMNAQAVPFCAKTYFSFVNALNMGSVVPLTNGDQSGAMSPIMGSGMVTMGNPKVYLELLPATNLTSPATGNNMLAALGAVLVPSVTNVFLTYSLPGTPGGGADMAPAPRAIEADMEMLSALARELGPPRDDAPEVLHADDVACLRVPVFSTGVPARVYDLLRRAGTGLRALVIDLRGCPGGELMSAIELAGDFLPEGSVVATVTDSDGDETVYRSRQERPYRVPLVLLVDRGTASAAEVLAGALQAHGRAVVVGERTFGKGVAQQMSPGVAGQGVYCAPVGVVTLPGGKGLQGCGVVPDVHLRELGCP